LESRRNAQNPWVDRDPDPAVLLVEDNEVNQAVAVAMLRRHGYSVDVVENGREALDAVASTPYAAVLMDCQMPVMDGYTATAELRRRENGGDHVPIIALTAHAVDGERERCLAAGMDDFLAKPVRADELVATLERLIEPRLLDPIALQQLQDAVGNEAMVARIVDMFFAQATTHLDAIMRAVAAGDADTASRCAHSLKGGAATVGAVGVARIAREVEGGDLAAAERLAEALERTRAELAPG
jgi:CheY-like chemotaxis protein